MFATAAGPGLTGSLIDSGVSYPAQIIAMGLYCFAACAMFTVVSLRLKARQVELSQSMPADWHWST